MPPGIRYLLANNPAASIKAGKTSQAIAGGMKESPRDFVDNTRKIFYTEKSIIAKKEETEKLMEYIVMENERLSEAIRTFKDDQARFDKYVGEQELDFANTK